MGGGQSKRTRRQSTRTQKRHSGTPGSEGARDPKSSAHSRRWTRTPRPTDTLRLFKGTQSSDARPGTRAADPSQARPRAPAGPTAHSHGSVPEAFKHGQRSVVATLAQQGVHSQEQTSQLRRGGHSEGITPGWNTESAVN